MPIYKIFHVYQCPHNVDSTKIRCTIKDRRIITISQGQSNVIYSTSAYSNGARGRVYQVEPRYMQRPTYPLTNLLFRKENKTCMPSYTAAYIFSQAPTHVISSTLNAHQHEYWKHFKNAKEGYQNQTFTHIYNSSKQTLLTSRSWLLRPKRRIEWLASLTAKQGAIPKTDRQRCQINSDVPARTSLRRIEITPHTPVQQRLQLIQCCCRRLHR